MESYQFCYDICVVLVLVERDDIILREQTHFLTPSPIHSTDTNLHVARTPVQCNDTSK